SRIRVGNVGREQPSGARAHPEATDHRTFTGTAAEPRCNGRREDAPGEPRERARLQPPAAGAGERGAEQAVAAEQRGLEPADPLDVVRDARLERHEAAGIEAQRLSRCEIARHDRTAGMNEREALAFELLQDEALAAEQAGADLLVPRDAEDRKITRL